MGCRVVNEAKKRLEAQRASFEAESLEAEKRLKSLSERERDLEKREQRIDAEVSLRVDKAVERRKQANAVAQSIRHPERGHEFDGMFPSS